MAERIERNHQLSARALLTPRIAPPQFAIVVTAIVCFPSFTYAVLGRYNHVDKLHVFADARVLKQYAACHGGSRTDVAAMTNPGRANDPGTRLHPCAGADVHRPFNLHSVPIDLGV